VQWAATDSSALTDAISSGVESVHAAVEVEFKQRNIVLGGVVDRWRGESAR
jgi:hypothetical protein